jgi:hypothetical protein
MTAWRMAARRLPEPPSAAAAQLVHFFTSAAAIEKGRF